jgi:hypothetical protein
MEAFEEVIFMTKKSLLWVMTIPFRTTSPTCQPALPERLIYRRDQAFDRAAEKHEAQSENWAFSLNSGADERNRTSDLLITNQLLYQLSYISEGRHSSKNLSPHKAIPAERNYSA